MKTNQTNNKTTLMRVLVLIMLLVAGVNNGAWAQRIASMSGDWDNIATWGGASVPSTTDDVIISSPRIVSIPNGYTALARNVTVNSGGGLMLIGATSALEMTGNLELNTGITSSAGSTVSFTGGTPQTISGDATADFSNLIINKTAGTVQLTHTGLGGVNVAGNLTITSGTLNINNRFISIQGNWTNNGTFSSGLTGTVTFNGTTPKTITGATTFNNLTIDKTATVPTVSLGLSTPITVSNALTLNNGRIVLGANNLTYGGTTAVLGSSTSWVDTRTGIGTGAFVRSVAGTGFGFPVGDGARYLPVTLFNSAANASVRFGVSSVTLPSVGVGSWYISNGISTSNVTLSAASIPTNLIIGTYNGSTWANLTAPTTATVFTASGYVFTNTVVQFAVYAPLASNDYFSRGNTTFDATPGFLTNWSNTLGGTDCNCSPAGNPNANVVIGAHTVTVQNATDIAGTATTITLANVASVLEFNAINTNPIGSLSGVAGSKIKMNVNALPVVANGSNAFIGTAGTIMEFASTTTGIIPIGFPNIPTPFPYKNVIISGGVTKNIAGDIIIDENLTINNTNTLGTNNKNINIKGNWINDGTFNAGTGTATVTFNGNSTQSIAGAAFPAVNFNNLVIANATGVNMSTMSASELNVNGTLTLTAGRLTIGAKDLRLTNITSAAQLSPATFISTSTSYVETNGGGRLIRSSLPAGIDFQFPVGDDIAIRLATINRSVVATGIQATTCRFRTGFTSPSPALPVGATNQASGTWGIEAQTMPITVTFFTPSTPTSTIYIEVAGSWVAIGTTIYNAGLSSYTATTSNGGGNFTVFTPVPTPTIFYSSGVGTGAWNLPASWSSTPLPTFTATTIPNDNATVVIQNGHTITVQNATDIPVGIDLDVQGGGVLLFNAFNTNQIPKVKSTLPVAGVAGKLVFNNSVGNFDNGVNNLFAGTANTTIEFASASLANVPNGFGTPAVYQNLIISGTGIKTLASDIIVEGNLTIAPGATFNNAINNKNINIKGNWTEDGTFTPGGVASTVTFNGANAQTITSPSPTNFHNIVVNNPAGVTLLTAINVNDITLTNGVVRAFSSGLYIKGNFTNNNTSSTVNTSVGLVQFKGNVTQTIGGSTITNFGLLEIANTGTGNLVVLAGDINVQYFRILNTTGGCSAGNFNINVSDGNASVNSWKNEASVSNFNAGIGTVTFNGTNAQSITGNTTFNNLGIANTNSAGVTLTGTTSNISVAGTLTLTNGRLITGANTVSIINTTGSISRVSGWVDTSGGGKLSRNILPTSTDFPVGDGSSIRLVKISPTSSGVATAGFVAGAPANPTANAINVFAGTWRLSSANPAVVAFTNAATAPDVKIRQQNATLWDEVATTFMSGTPPTYMSTSPISVVSNTTFALFEIGVPLIAPSTDIKFLPITVNNTANKITFSWVAVPNASSYEVRIGTINENNILVWGTSIVVPAAMLSYVNNNIQYDVTTYYSVRAIGATATLTSAWSSAVNIFVSSYNNPTTSLNNDISSLVKISPNPSSGDFIVDFGGINTAKIVVRVHNAQDKQVFISENNNSNKRLISLRDFANGIYLLEVQTEKGRILKKIVKAD